MKKCLNPQNGGLELYQNIKKYIKFYSTEKDLQK